jgi:Flp pilus assembly protein protease CpaA
MIQTITLYACLVLASLEDLRRREVPFLLSHATIILGVSFAALQSATATTITPIIHSVLGGIIAYTIGYALYVTGQWGGGDVKLLTGVATFIGFNPSSPHVFITYILLIFIAGSLYGLAWAITTAIRHHDAVQARVPSPLIVRTGTLVTGGLIIALMTSLLLHPSITPVVASLTLLVPAATIMYVFKNANDVLESKEKPVDKLVPGDWLTQPVSFDDETIENHNTGLSPDQIKALKKSNADTVTVQVGIPFVPSFLIAYVALRVTPIVDIIGILV